MSLRSRGLMLVVLGVVIGFSLSLGEGVMATKDIENKGLPLQQLKTFTNVFERIKRNYVEDTSDAELLESAIRGMLSGLDPHSSYLNEDEIKELRVGTTGEFGGLGIEVGMENGFVKVVAPIDGTPAEKAGMQSGDLIVRIDDAPVKGLTLGQAVKKMRGKPDTKIVLTVVRDGVDKPFVVEIVRAIIQVNSVRNQLLEKDFGYVRITQFQVKTPESLIKSIKQLKQENDGDLKGLVLDLRNNPGGVLSAAVGVSDAFLESGLVVYTDGREASSKQRFEATPGDIVDNVPIVVLINGGSASASEIVAGALQDHKRGVIMGSQSFGKGSVQTIQDLPGGGALKLTTARYFTSSGRSIQALGITPDIEIGSLRLEGIEKPAIARMSESTLSGHLSNPGEEDNATEKTPTGNNKDEQKSSAKTAPKGPLAKRDYVLFEALSLLKGMAVFQTIN